MLQNLREQVQRRGVAEASSMRALARPIALAVAVAIAYFLTARVSLYLMTPPGVAVFWPPAGVSLGTLIALGRPARWPVAVGVIAATIAANLMGDRNLLTSSIFALSDAGEALLVAWMIERYIGSDFNLGRLRHVLALLVASVVGTAVSGFGGTLGYKLAHSPGDSAWAIWQQWVTSDSIGIIAVAPLIIGVAGALRAPPSRRELIEGVVALVAVAGTTNILVFMLPPSWWEMFVLVVLLFPLLLWVAARYQPAFASAAVFIVSLIVIATVTLKLGYFGNTVASIDEHIMSAQITIVGTAFCALILSALFAERRQHEAVVAERETRLQEALAAGTVMAFEWDVATDVVRRSNNAVQIVGLEPRQTLNGTSFLARVNPDDVARMKASWSNLDRDSPTCSNIYRFLHFDGREVWLHEIAKAEFDGAGRLMRLKGLARDITERKRAEEHQSRLIAELDHRVKNLLARVAAVVMYTRDGSDSVDDFARALDRRIQSMADAHLLLSESRWQGVDLLNLVEHQVAPYTNKANITIEGPQVALTAVATQAVAMVLHELVTNAVKYGALSRPVGQVAVSWMLRANGGAPKRVMVEWRETGGPPVAAPARFSYGTSLIRDLIPHELGGTADVLFPIEGVRCRIEFPL